MNITDKSLSGCKTIGNMGSFSLRIIYLSISRAVTDLTKSILSSNAKLFLFAGSN